jgi:hypothetical protein
MIKQEVTPAGRGAYMEKMENYYRTRIWDEQFKRPLDTLNQVLG